MSESRSSVSHIQTERDVPVEHILDALYHIFCRTCLMFASPVVEPSAPELATHQRSFGAKFFKFFKLLVDIGACSKVHGPNQVIERVIGEVTAPVTLKQRYIGKTGFTNQVAHGRDIRFVDSIRTVFILYLYHDNISPFIHLQRSQLLTDLFHKDAYPFHIIGIERTQGYIFFLQQPPGKSPHLPLRTYIRTRTDNDIHTVFLCHTAESCNIILTGKIELSFFLFMDIPENINTNSIHA